MAAQTEPLDPAETQHSWDISNTSPLTTDLSQTRGAAGKEGSTQGTVPANATSASLQTHSKNPSPRNLPRTVASSGDALPHDRDLLLRGWVRTRR